MVRQEVLVGAAFHFFLVFTSAFSIPQYSLPVRCTPCRMMMHAGGRWTTEVNHDMVREMLWRMTGYFSSMVDTSRQRFYYRCLPTSGKRLHGHCPIRDLGAAWDTTTVLLYWRDQQEWLAQHDHSMESRQQRLTNAVCNTLRVYDASYTRLVKQDGVRQEKDDAAEARGGGVAISQSILLEPPNIAHSAFVLLATAGALRLSIFSVNDTLPPVNDLVGGVLAMQRKDGAFRIEFGNKDVYRGIEFYPGEAMLALMDAYEVSGSIQGILETSTRKAILPAMERALHFYSNFYRHGNVGARYTSFFANWQVQAFAKLFDAFDHSEKEPSPSRASAVADYILELCQSIVQSGSWKELAKGPSAHSNLSTVEIACGLEALAEGTRVALEVSRVMDATLFWTNATNAIEFLKSVQDQMPERMTGSGGLGHGLRVVEQRLDVTGHAINALTKVDHVLDKWAASWE